MYISRESNLALRTAVSVALVVLSTLLFCVVLAPAPALALPEGRVYEMVSPPYKGGFDAGLVAVSPDGESVAFQSYGVFAHLLWANTAISSYVAHRGPTGWATTALSPPPTFEGIADFSANLGYTLTAGSLESRRAYDLGGTIGDEFVLHRTDAPDMPQAWGLASWEVAGNHSLTLLHDEPFGKGGLEGESADLCHIFLGHAEGPLLPEAEGTSLQVYDFSTAPAAGCPAAGARSLRLVSVKNTPGPQGEPEPIDGKCLVEAGVGGGYSHEGKSASFNRFPDGGEEIFFTAGFGASCSQHQLFVRLGGEKTIEVSRPSGEECDEARELPCPAAGARANADFVGASEDGSRVFFTTEASSSELYMDTIGCPVGEQDCAVSERQVTSQVQVSHAPTPGEAGDVQGVVRIAADGSRVYFVARGVLSEGANVEGEDPVKGADNLYVYDAIDGKTTFIADLSGADSGLWGFGQEAQSNTCERSSPAECVGSREPGRYLVFSTYAQLVRSDTDNAKDIYRYDAQTGALERVSVGEGGYDANGNGSDGTEPPERIVSGGGSLEGGNETVANATIPTGGVSPGANVLQERELGSRAISEDGSRIVFSTAEPLSPDAVNGLVNVYEWHEGSGVSLISSGSSLTGDADAVISPSGRDVFFQTAAQLVPQDTDEDVDVYDARLEGPGEGFPVAAAEPEPCSGDACQGPLTNPAPLLVPGSVSQAPGGNFAAPVPATTVKPKAKPVKCKKGFVKEHDKCVRRPRAKKSTHRKGSK